jgi:hypothetical protein
MLALMLFWQAGPHNQADWHGGWHPGFFMFGPGVFWLGLLCVFAVLWLSRRRDVAPDNQWRQAQQHQRPAAPPAPAPDEPTGRDAAWPNLDATPPDQPEQQEADIEYF